MALAVHEPLTELDEVQQACLDFYRRAGSRAEPISWQRLLLGEAVTELPPTPVVLVREQRHIECIVANEVSLTDYLGGLRRMLAEDWTVTVLVHSAHIGEAHRTLRSVGVMIQPWWQDARTVHFGRPEIP